VGVSVDREASKKGGREGRTEIRYIHEGSKVAKVIDVILCNTWYCIKHNCIIHQMLYYIKYIYQLYTVVCFVLVRPQFTCFTSTKKYKY
jgi:hypothetical protein